MNASQEMQAIINTISDPILIIGPSRGRLVACNKAFVDEWGFSEDTFMDRSFLRLPQFSRTILRGLIRIYTRARHRKAKIDPYVFQLPHSDGTLRTISATASPLDGTLSGERCVILRFQILPSVSPDDMQRQEDAVAFNIFADISQEPWLEFRPSIPILAPHFEDGDKTSRLAAIGHRLHLHRASKSAVNFYGLQAVRPNNSSSSDANGKKNERHFLSFFYREEDALRLLDILTTIGFVKAGTSLVDRRGQVMDAEISCAIQFGVGNTITALYCIFHFSEDVVKYRDMLNENRREKEFILNQPFLGVGQLVPKHPLDRPDAVSADEELENYLDTILLMAANDALIGLHGMQKQHFMMRSMPALFPERTSAVLVLKELFVTRQTSFATYDDEGALKNISIFKAVFNNSDQLIRIHIASSPHSLGFAERYNNLPVEAEPDSENADPENA